MEALDNLERELKLLFKVLDLYYEEYESETSVNLSTFLSFFDLKYPKSKDREIITDLVHSAFDADTKEELVMEYLDQLNEKYTATHIVNMLVPVMEGTKYKILPKVRDMASEFVDSLHHRPVELTVPTPCTLTPRELIEQEKQTPGLPWRLEALTNVIGGLKPRTLGLIYAFVDAGKTSFTLDNVAHWSTYLQDEQTIAYCGNEEEAKRLRRRLMQAYLKRPWSWMMENMEEAVELCSEHEGFDKVHIFEDITHGDQILYVLKNYRPHLLVIDQATNVDIKTARKSEGVEYLKHLFQWYRRQANEFNTAVVGVSQGVGDAENTKWLKLSDIYGSRVAIQGALDYAIGIGRKVDDAALSNKRYINIPKNKLNNGDSARLSVSFFNATCQWKET